MLAQVGAALLSEDIRHEIVYTVFSNCKQVSPTDELLRPKPKVCVAE